MTALILSAALTLVAAQPPADRPVRWEYAELSYSTTRARPAMKDNDGKEVAAAVPASVSLRWSTGADEVAVKGWDELAGKLKVTLKKDSAPATHRLQVLNALGADGWELVAVTADTSVVGRVASGGFVGGIGGGGGRGGRGGAAAPGGLGGAGGFSGVAGPGPAVGTTVLFKRRVP